MRSYIYVVPNLYIPQNDFTKYSAKIIASIYYFWIYKLSNHKIQDPLGLVAGEIKSNSEFWN